MMFAIILIILLLLAIYKYSTRNHDYWRSRGVPGPKPQPFLGNLLEVFRKPLSDIEEQRFRDYGRVHGFYDFNEPVLTVGEPELIKQILVKDFQSFHNRRQLRVSSKYYKFFDAFLLFSRDDHWRRLRATLSPTFSSAKLKRMHPMIDRCCDSVLQKLDEYSRSHQPLDVKWLFGAYTMNVIAKCAFATDTDALRDRDNPFVRWASRVINVPLWRMIVFLFMPSFLKELLNFTIATPESFKFFVDVAQHVLNDRKGNSSSHGLDDFLQLLVDAERGADDPTLHELSATDEELAASRRAFSMGSHETKKLSEEEIIANIVLFLLAGYETTASLLSFSAYNLALNPESQRKLRDELRECPHLDYESVAKLPFLEAVVCETLRIHNPVTRVDREAFEDYVLGDTGITLTKGSVVAIPVHALHHDPHYYPDPHRFIPERFLGDNLNKVKPYTYLPFGGGPRNCIGMRFALLEAKLALARVLMDYEFSPCAKTEVPLRFVNTRPGLLQAVSIWVNVERRN